MSDRAHRLKRLVTVQRHLEKMAEMELAELTMERGRIADRMDALSEAMSSPNPVHSGFSRLYGIQLGHLKTKDQQLVGRSRLQEKKLMSERAKGDRLDDRLKTVRDQMSRDAEDQAVYDVLDAMGNDGNQASRKLRHS